MSKTDLLDELFKVRKNSGKSFAKDGIIDEYEYENANAKILFIAKEPNHTDNPKGHCGDYRDDWDGKYKLESPFATNLERWSHGILESFPKLDDIYDKNCNGKYIRKIAFMNVKKSGGKGKSEDKVIRTYIEQNKDFIKKQIEIIAPELIILCLGGYDENINDILGIEQWLPSGYYKEIALGNIKGKKFKVIDFYHPSTTGSNAALYTLLKTIVESEEFKNL